MRQTNLKKYGTEYVFGSEKIKEKIKKTNNEKYGCDYGLSNPEIIKKREDTLQERYGINNSKQIPGLLNTQFQKYENNLKEHNTIFTLVNYEFVDKY